MLLLHPYLLVTYLGLWCIHGDVFLEDIVGVVQQDAVRGDDGYLATG